MIDCSCNRISDKTFRAAVETKKPEIEKATDLLKGVALVYRAARDESDRPHAKPCTTCFQTVACYIRQAGFFQDQKVAKHNRYGTQPTTP